MNTPSAHVTLPVKKKVGPGRRTKISVSARAACPFSIAEEYATEYLRSAEAGGPESMIRVPWQLPFPAPHRRLAISFGLQIDVLEGGRQHEEVRFSWKSGSRFLPDFRGWMRFRIEHLGTCVLVDGDYAVPFGILGRCFDGAFGRRMARASLQELADRVTRYLEERERVWRTAHAGPSDSA
jgi:hypothetical protein